MAPYRQVIADAGIPADVQPVMLLAVNRSLNMVPGQRPSDAARSEVDAYRSLGHDQYLQTVAAAGQQIRELGY